ncbi:exonuclease domain-containing protein [Leucobacter edaphi]|nr:exonuclease domain-containing protein [Leucobacter edaphi]
MTITGVMFWADTETTGLRPDEGLLLLGTGHEMAPAEAEIIQHVRQVCGDERPAFAGNSINPVPNCPHEPMPSLNDEVLGYRNIDVSSITELASRWSPDLAQEVALRKSGTHRVMGDILESIAELRLSREPGFVGAGT